jgi:transcription elongation factor Elf1
MSDAERPPGPDVQQCPSCGSTAVSQALVEARKVWFVCRRCDARWSIPDRRSSAPSAYDGPERRGG